MTNALFLYNNLVDVGSVYATSENSDLPGTNVQHGFRTKAWEVGSPVADLVIDFGSAKAVTGVTLANYDWAAAPNSLYLEFSATSFTPDAAATQGLTWTVNPTVNGLPATIIKTFTLNSTYQFARLRVHANSVWQLGRLFLGPHFEPSLNMLHTGFSERYEDDSKISRSVGGQDHVDVVEEFRSLAMRFPVRTQAQLDEFNKLWTTIKRTTDFFLALDYDNEPNEKTMYGKLESDMRVARPSYSQWNVTLAFQESR